MRRHKPFMLVLIVGVLAGIQAAIASPQMPVVKHLAEADGVDDNGPPVIPGHGSDVVPRPKDREIGKPPDAKPPTRAESLDVLFARLAETKDVDEATGISTLIQRLWMESGSDTADLLMARAMTAMGENQKDIARALLDKVVALRPGWAEAWNKRATLRFLADDDAGSMEDISHALSLEPRHFGALSGLGFILKRNGLEPAALKALRRAQAIYPESQDIRKAVDELIPDVEGRDL